MLGICHELLLFFTKTSEFLSSRMRNGNMNFLVTLDFFCEMDQILFSQ